MTILKSFPNLPGDHFVLCPNNTDENYALLQARRELRPPERQQQSECHKRLD